MILSTQAENREYLRLPESFSVNVQKITYPAPKTKGKSGNSLDLSGNGLRFRFNEPLAPKTVLRLEMNLWGWQRHKRNVASVLDDNSAIAPLTAIAEVVWSNEAVFAKGYEIGVRFIDIYEDDHLALKKYLRQLEAD